MRMDFYHCGNATEETYYFDELKEEPYYAGSYVSLRDSFNYGNQRFVLLDKETGREIYSFHYCTLWGEWQCTPEARTTSLGMPESIVFPYPKRDAIAQIWSRGNPHDPAVRKRHGTQPWVLKATSTPASWNTAATRMLNKTAHPVKKPKKPRKIR